jgi:hypothetical protein
MRPSLPEVFGYEPGFETDSFRGVSNDCNTRTVLTALA